MRLLSSCLLVVLMASVVLAHPATKQPLSSGNEKMGLSMRGATAWSTQPLVLNAEGNYVLNVSIGTPAQTFRLLFDIASSNMWVIDKRCRLPDCVGPSDANYTTIRFDPSRSTSFKNLGIPASITYYDMGTAVGVIGKDRVSYSGTLESKQRFVVVNDPPRGFGYWSADGVVGFAWPALAAAGTDAPLKQLEIFSVWLDNKPVPAGSVGGLVSLNAIDGIPCDAEAYRYVLLTAQTYWQVTLDSLSIGDFKFAQPQQAFLDTSAQLASFEPAQFLAVAVAINASYDPLAGYLVDCNAKLPDIVLAINGLTFTIAQEQYLYPTDTAGVCGLLIDEYTVATADPSAPTSVLGQPFLKGRCVSFDAVEKRIGIAAEKSRN